MKSFNFIELLDIIENTVSPQSTLDRSHVASGDENKQTPDELSELFNSLQDITKIPAPELLLDFGNYLFGRLVEAYPAFIIGASSSFEFLTQVEDRVFSEVKQRFPVAQLPHLSYAQPRPDQLQIRYQSLHPYPDLVQGLIGGCAAHFQENLDIQISVEDLGQAGKRVEFNLTKTS